MVELENLIEDYRRKVANCTKMLADLPNELHAEVDKLRISTKKGCFQATLVELERLRDGMKREEYRNELDSISYALSKMRIQRTGIPTTGLFGEQMLAGHDAQIKALENRREEIKEKLSTL